MQFQIPRLLAHFGDDNRFGDANGNRTNVDLSGGSSSGGAITSSNNRLLYDAATGYYFTYDAVGNRTARFMSDSGLLDSTATNITTYGWDNKNELVSVKTFGDYSAYTANLADEALPATEVDYEYDPFANLVSRATKDSGGGVTSDENYINDGTEVTLVLNGAGQVKERELYGPAVNQVLASETVATSGGWTTQPAGTANWMLADMQGSVRDVLQMHEVIFSGGGGSGGYASVALADHIDYDAWGNIVYQSNPSVEPRLLYNGTRYDAATGLYFNVERWYDPKNGNWMSQDPLGFAAGQTNLQEYAGNSPTNYTDPIGLDVSSWLFGAVNNAAANPPPNIMLQQANPSETPVSLAEELNLQRGSYGTSPLATVSVSSRQFAGEVAVIGARVGVEVAHSGGASTGDGPVRGLMQGAANALNGAQNAAQDLLRLIAQMAAGPAASFMIPEIKHVDWSRNLYYHESGTKGGWDDSHGWSEFFGGFGLSILTGEGLGSLFEALSAADVCDYINTWCFPAGTLVAAAQGNVAIEAIRRGNEVWGYDLVTSQWRLCRVLETFVNDYEGHSAFIAIPGETIESTSGHPFWVVRGEDLPGRRCPNHIRALQGATTVGRWVEAADIRPGDDLLMRDGRIVAVESVRLEPLKGKVYNFSVAELESYAVGQNNVLVHNTGSCGHFAEWNLFGPRGGLLNGGEEFSGLDFSLNPGEFLTWFQQAWYGHTEGKVIAQLIEDGEPGPGQLLSIEGELIPCGNCQQIMQMASDVFGMRVTYENAAGQIWAWADGILVAKP